MLNNKIRQIERFASETMDGISNLELRLAHDFKHVDRVRGWMVQIAQSERYEDLDVVEAAALLHDIGLAHVEDRREHAPAGAELAAQFLRKHGLFDESQIELIEAAIRCHASTSGGGKLGEMLRDADKMELFGAIGILRCQTSRYALADFPQAAVKGETWQMSIASFEERFAAGQGIGNYIVEHINFQMSLIDDLYTDTARQLAEPLVAYTRNYLRQLEAEVLTSSAYSRGDSK